MTHHRRPLALACLAAIALPSAPAAAATFCVSTPAEFRSAIDAAETNGQNNEIRIRTGIYPTGGMPFEFSTSGNFSFTVTGGWSGGPGQCTTQLRNPALTVFDGGGSGQVMRIANINSTASAQLYAGNFALTGGSVQNGGGGCLGIVQNVGSPTMQVDRIIVTGCSNLGGAGTGGGVRISKSGPGTIVLSNSNVYDNTADRGAGVALSSVSGDGFVRVVGNTIVDNINQSGNGGAGLFHTNVGTPNGIIELRNNAILRNSSSSGAAADLLIPNGVPGVSAFRNALSVPSQGPLQIDSNFIVAEPRFIGASNYRLNSASPLRNAGAELSPSESVGRDLDFRPRVAEGVPDVGAYESAPVFISGFE